MVVILQIIAAAGSNDVEIMAALRPTLARCHTGAIEHVVGIVHLIDTEDGFQAALIEGLVVGHKGKIGNLGLYLLPYLGKDGSILGIISTQAVHLTAPVVVIIWLWLDERVEPVSNLTVTHDDDANSADRRPFVVGCFKVYCSKVLHLTGYFC